MRPPITVELLTARSVRVGACLEWGRARTARGYGRVGHSGREFYTHRLMWELTNGRPIPDGMVVRHRCDNPPCLEPAHLDIGTVADNARDAMERGRIVGSKLKGSQIVTSKLTEAQVAEIKALLRGGAQIKATARLYGVSKYPVWAIANGLAWKHVK